MIPEKTIPTMDELFAHAYVKEKGGIVATDFARLCGAYVAGNGRSWVWSAFLNIFDNVRVLACDGNFYWIHSEYRHLAVCPASHSSLISSSPRTGVSGEGWYEVATDEEYPQTVAPNQKEIEEAFRSGKAKKTGRTFTTDSRAYDEYDKPFEPRVLDEVEIGGKKYVRVEALRDNVLENNQEVEKGDAFWVEVEPVKYAVDEATGTAITAKGIASGVQFLDTQKDGSHTEYNGDIETTRLNWFLQNHLAKEMRAGSEALEFISNAIEKAKSEDEALDMLVPLLNKIKDAKTQKELQDLKYSADYIMTNWKYVVDGIEAKLQREEEERKRLEAERLEAERQRIESNRKSLSSVIAKNFGAKQKDVDAQSMPQSLADTLQYVIENAQSEQEAKDIIIARLENLLEKAKTMQELDDALGEISLAEKQMGTVLDKVRNRLLAQQKSASSKKLADFMASKKNKGED